MLMILCCISDGLLKYPCRYARSNIQLTINTLFLDNFKINELKSALIYINQKAKKTTATKRNIKTKQKGQTAKYIIRIQVLGSQVSQNKKTKN